MEIKEYQKKVLRTDAEDYSGFQKRLLENKTTVHGAIKGFMISSGTLDLMKKRLAYDAQPDKMFRADAQHSAIIQNFNNPIFLDKIAESTELSQLFHYVIGMITETNELMVALAKGAITGTLDKVNVGEELGDILYYNSAIAERLGIDMNDILKTNIKKLEIRYPIDFNNELANNRRLNEELEVLKNGINS